ncbi:protein phosphatase 2C 29-like [Nymphaea colorata]|nr:protein phosphatase 2C 29-like [Nymphaea colorata]XP_049933413.1 protein phosphatase 2C 29-like [Nymphaea colorata]XP_049933414.1 protein phosphatase 2C 29-like [Nymphaea colorata]XP_049933415.1 protein phosphatase 2C 29-like [Nymphaea colorata]XP_049933416.1 protein phosphatase 2C 29-like [Nymphaea colorata]XP_049933417.1 protein phosphatase 2C 29-like [Nymphaea colorata]XP_049933418.1 protein phosphatase 2C 29-like [Nymphaea colorata]XP_049933419.1 protein phosphatase 2C 29-like [Nympha
MGNGVSVLLPCVRAGPGGHHDLIFSEEPLDQTLGHSFCYIRHGCRLLSPSDSGRFSPSSSCRLAAPAAGVAAETTFRSISGASVSANSSAPIAVFSQGHSDHDGGLGFSSVGGDYGFNVGGKNGDNFFVSSSFFSSLPLQPVPRVLVQQSQELGNSGRFERGFMSGPLERGAASGPLDSSDGIHFSAPLGGYYLKKKKKRHVLSGVAIKRAFQRNFSEKKRPWVFPVLNFVGLHQPREVVSCNGNDNGNDNGSKRRYCDDLEKEGWSRDFGDGLQWAHGKAGEDRVHVVVSEENGWLFVGIYDGFNGPDAPEFLMSNLYKAIFDELEGLFWETTQDSTAKENGEEAEDAGGTVENLVGEGNGRHPPSKIDDNRLADDGCSSSRKHDGDPAQDNGKDDTMRGNGLAGEGAQSIKHTKIGKHESNPSCGSIKRVTFQEEAMEVKRGKLLWELLAEEDDDGFSTWGSGRFGFRTDNADCDGSSTAEAEQKERDGRYRNDASTPSTVNATDSLHRPRKGTSLLFSKLKLSFNKHKENRRKLSGWSYDLDKEKIEVENQVDERSKHSLRKYKTGPVDHDAILKALSKALETTELAYLDMTHKAIDQNPELALMGSCLLVVLMKDEDVYVMNLGDSRAIVAQYQPELDASFRALNIQKNFTSALEGILEDASDRSGNLRLGEAEFPAHQVKLTALQLSTDHSTSIEEEVLRIKREHPDDSQCIVNDRVKGRLKVTRAFGAGFLKQAGLNNALLEMFRNEYIGTAPYISSSPSLRHYRLGPSDQFLVLSSDGLYQYLSNQEVVSYVENFMDKFPDGDPAQYLIEELLFRAAKKAGMEFHELLDIPQGDRRKYHDDVTVMVISLEGRIWKSSGKYL